MRKFFYDKVDYHKFFPLVSGSIAGIAFSTIIYPIDTLKSNLILIDNNFKQIYR